MGWVNSRTRRFAEDPDNIYIDAENTEHNKNK